MTVQEMVARLHRRVDPKTKDFVVIDNSNVGTVDGSRFTAQRVLDIYNQARTTITGAILRKFPNAKRALTRILSGNIVYSETVSFVGGAALQPDGYIFSVDLEDAEGNQIYVLGLGSKRAVKNLERATNRFVFEFGGFLKASKGSTFIPDGDYFLTYYKLAPFVLSDVTGGETLETYNSEWADLLEEIAVLIANEVGDLEISSIVEKFFLQTSGQGA